MELKFCPLTILRETPKLTLFDEVIHSGEAISPPNEFEYEVLSAQSIN